MAEFGKYSGGLVTYQDDTVKIKSPGFNNKIISKKYNFTQDYFELRAQPCLGQTGKVSVPPESVIINRDGGLISSIVKASKTVTITRNLDNSIASVSDGAYRKDIVRVGGVITEINVVVL